jgi:hypothetical protein
MKLKPYDQFRHSLHVKRGKMFPSPFMLNRDALRCLVCVCGDMRALLRKYSGHDGLLLSRCARPLSTTFFFFRYGVGSYRKTIVFLFLYGHCEWKRYLEPILTLKVDKTTVLKFLFTI